MIKNYQSGSFIIKDSLLEALKIGQKKVHKIQQGKAPVISVVGAGGKTTLITKLVKEYRERKIPVIVTTTTHMLAEAQPWFLLDPAYDKVLETLKQEGMAWVGLPDKNGKMKAPPMEFLGKILKWGYPVLIEADGAKRLPLKAPAEHEPVILPETTCVLNVYGLDAVGKRFEEVCFRAETAVRILNRKLTDTVEAEDIAGLALSRLSGRKGLSSAMEYRVILNKADAPEREKAAADICEIAARHGFTGLTVTAGK